MNPELKPFVDSLGLEYKATFVPQSMSRNAGEKDPSLNWRIHLRKVTDPIRPASVVIETDYMQGIGHLSKVTIPGPKSNRYVRSCLEERERTAAETGKAGTKFSESLGGTWLNTKPIPPPDVMEVLYSLVTDSDADEHTFEEWASNFGYDTDSRKAEATYNQCRDIGTKLRRMIGHEALAKLRELFQDY